MSHTCCTLPCNLSCDEVKWYPLDTGRKLNVHETLNVSWTSSLSSIYVLCLGSTFSCHFQILATGFRGGSNLLNYGGGPNSEIFLSDPRELFQRVQFFCSIKNFLIFRGSMLCHLVFVIARNWVYVNQFINTCVL